jgi:hypothetical protein
MTLAQATQTYSVAGLDQSALAGQEKAFQTCLKFLEGVEKTKRQNPSHSTYGYKHIVEDPAGRYGIPCETECYSGYVYEGTFILAALSSGFTIEQRIGDLSATFNISERSLKRRTKQWADSQDGPSYVIGQRGIMPSISPITRIVSAKATTIF